MKVYLKVLEIFLKACITLIPILFLCLLFYRDLVVSGTLKAEYDFEKKSSYISVLRPQERLSDIEVDDGDYYQRIIDQPLYFDIRTPQRFSVADVSITYKNFDQSIFELGLITDQDAWSFDLKGLDNVAVNYLFDDGFHWASVHEGETYLFQKQPTFLSIEEFLNNLPPHEKIATYNYKIFKSYILPRYSKKSGQRVINKSLRGNHTIYTYIKDEPLDFHFLLQDINRHPGGDNITFEVFYGSEPKYSDFMTLDSVDTDNWEMSEIQDFPMYIDGLVEGLYRIEIETPIDDIVIRQIKTSQYMLAFYGNIYLGDNVGYNDEFDKERLAPTTVYTNGNYITAYTAHKEGIQVLDFGKEKLLVEDTHKPFTVESTYGLKPVDVKYNDVRLSTKGFFSFSKDSFFNPTMVDLSDGLDFDRESIDFALVNYSPPIVDGDWKTKKISFDLLGIPRESGMLHFILSAPRIEADDQGILISNIKVELRKNALRVDDLFDNIKDIFSL